MIKQTGYKNVESIQLADKIIQFSQESIESKTSNFNLKSIQSMSPLKS